LGQHLCLEPHLSVVKHFLSEDLPSRLAVGVGHVVGVVDEVVCVVRLLVLVHKLVFTHCVLQLQLRGFHVCNPSLVLKSLLLDLQLLNLRLVALELLGCFLVQSLRFLKPANQLEHLLLLLGFALPGLLQLQLHLLHSCELPVALAQ
jgi:hypothetical protein